MTMLLITPVQADVSYMVGELEVAEVDSPLASPDEQRVAESFNFKTYNTDPGLLDTWDALFGVIPDTSLDDVVTLQGDKVVIWREGTVSLHGGIKIKIKTDKKDPNLKEIKIEKAGKHDGATILISATGGVNPHIANGGWHEVKVKNLDGVEVSWDGRTVTGFVKELKIEMDKDSTPTNPVIKKFKLKIKAATTAPDVIKDMVTSPVIIKVPETKVTALGGTEYEEEIKERPKVLSGHIEAVFKRESDALTEGVDISSLNDGYNNQLKARKGPCDVGVVVCCPICGGCPCIPPCDGTSGGDPL